MEVMTVTYIKSGAEEEYMQNAFLISKLSRTDTVTLLCQIIGKRNRALMEMGSTFSLNWKSFEKIDQIIVSNP